MTKTEIEHAWFGLGTALMAVTALWAWHRPKSVARFIWPAIALLIGLALLVPAETGIGHYEPAGWVRTLLDLVPVDPRAWLGALSQVHVMQHKTAGVLTLVIGVVELSRSAHKLRAPYWGRLLPYISIAIGLVLSIHGGTGAHLPHHIEQMHHWIFGLCFITGGVLLALHQSGRLRSSVWRDAWGALVLAAGIDLLFFYRLP